MSEPSPSAGPKENENNKLEMLGFEQQFVWTISEFSKLPKDIGKQIDSPIFHLGIDGDWQLNFEIFPNGEDEDTKDHVGLFIYLKSISDKQIIADYRVFLIDAEEKQHDGVTGTHTFKQNEGEEWDSWGESEFISKNELVNEEKGFLKNDKLIVYCNIRLLSNKDSCIADSTPKKRLKLEYDLEQLFKDDEFSDVTLVASGKKILAHKNILACRSPVFHAMFRHDMKEKRESKVDINDVDPEVLQELLRFIYCGKVDNLCELVGKLLIAADKYQVDDLKILCEGYLHENLCTDNAISALEAADRYKFIDLKKYALNFISENSKAISATEEFEMFCCSGSHLVKEVFSKISEDFEEAKKALQETDADEDEDGDADEDEDVDEDEE